MQPNDQLSAALAGRYAIDREIGAGGMATVYLADDVRHGRKVAIKVLHPELSAMIGADRFLAEIRTTAALQHPHILPLFDSGSAGGLLYYVMPFVEGETLRARLTRDKQLPIADAVRIASEVASALDYAHRRGIIHRDIKPENILLHEGQALVADFGIALAVQTAGGQRMTQTGLSLGTPQYMSPEQAMGEREISARSDVYALGAVTYEMLAGEPPFTGPTAQAIVAKVVTEQPKSLTMQRRSVPPHVDLAVLTALEKLPADRFSTGRQFAEAIEGRSPSILVSGADAAASRRALSRLVPWLVAVGMIALALGFAVARAMRTSDDATAQSVRFTIEPPAGVSLLAKGDRRPFALSGDGRTIAFAGSKGPVFIRPLDRLQATPVPNVMFPQQFALSADGTRLAYTNESGRTLSSVRLGGDVGVVPTVLADTGIDLDSWMDWTHGANVVDVTNDRTASRLWVGPGAGGARRIVAMGDRGKERWRSPWLLPDGKTIAIRAASTGGRTLASRIVFVSIDGTSRTTFNLPATSIVGSADGHLFYGDDNGRVFGVAFDPEHRRARGQPVLLLENVVFGASGLQAMVGTNGTLAYMAAVAETQVDVVDDRGTLVSTVPVEPHVYSNVDWSPDGRQLLLHAKFNRTSDLFVYDTTTHVTTRLTRTGDVPSESWMPDGKHVAVLAPTSKTTLGLMPQILASDGSGQLEPIAGTGGVGAFRISPDGQYLVGFVDRRKASPDESYPAPMTAIPLHGGERVPLLADLTQPSVPCVSPGGRWMAFISRESGQAQAVVRPFPTGAGQLQVSSHGAHALEWSRDGRLYYRAGDTFRRATLDLTGKTPRLVRDDSLFSDPSEHGWSLHPDGKHIALLHNAGGGAKLVVVTNWVGEALPKLKAR